MRRTVTSGASPATRRLAMAAGAAVLVAGMLAPTRAAAQDEFRWRGRLEPGRTLEVKGINGEVRALAADGDEIEVVARKHGRRSDPEDVRIERVEHDGGITFCAVYPDVPGERPNRCAPGDEGRMSTRKNDVVVDFTVRVPRGVRFAGRTVNGGIEIESLESDAVATTVNGGVRLSTSGYAEATTVNGSIVARLGSADWTGTLAFETVNGGITLELPPEVSTRISVRTVNGDISTDFPLTVSGRFNTRSIRGTIGSGGRALELATVNGSITLRKQ